MKTIEADLKVLANINFAGKVYQLREVNFEQILSLQDSDDQQEATFDLIECAGIPKDVSKKLSLGTIKQIEKLLVGELSAEKK